MALIECKFFSETIGVSSAMHVILPQPAQGEIGVRSRAVADRHPTLFLLHGMSDDHTIWLRRTSIERYVSALGLAVVMPAVHRSFYTDQAHGYNYWTFVSEELPAIARSFFPLSNRREDTFVAGLSMGGYGAFKLALRRPDLFSAAASLSGALNIARRADEPSPEFIDTFGDAKTVRGSDNDLLHLADDLAASDGAKPLLYQCCGTEDFLYDDNQTFRRHAESLGLPLTYEEGPGTHEWGYWDASIQRVLNWLPLGS